MDIKEIPINKITPYDGNPRNNDVAVDAVKYSIKEFGFKVPIVIDKNNVVVCGHTRLRSAIELELKKVPCVVAEDLSEEQVKAFRLIDNRVSEFSKWDDDLFDEELGKIENIDMTKFEVYANSIFESDDFFTIDEEQTKKESKKKKKKVQCPFCGEWCEI